MTTIYFTKIPIMSINWYYYIKNLQCEFSNELVWTDGFG